MTVPAPIGPVVRGNRWYVERNVIRSVKNFLVQGMDINLVGGWQSGKTSILFALRDPTEPLDWATAYVDLAPWATISDDAKWYELLADHVHKSLLPDAPRERIDFNLLKPTHLIEYVVNLVKSVQPHWPVILMLDEIAAVPPSVQRAFFPAIRSLQNLRRDSAAPRELSNLLFIFSGQFSPERLITNSNNSPFNQAHTIDVTEHDLSVDNINELIQRTGIGVDPDAIWQQTSGHPYLTVTMLGLVEEGNDVTVAAMKLLVGDRHFANLSRELWAEKRSAGELAIRLAEGEVYPYIPGIDVDLDHLVTLGLVKWDDNANVKIRCRLYEQFILRSKSAIGRASTSQTEEIDTLDSPPVRSRVTSGGQTDEQRVHSLVPAQNVTHPKREDIVLGADKYKGEIDFGIISIRDDEFEAILDRFQPNEYVEKSRRYEIGVLPTVNKRHYRYALVRLPQQGVSEAQNATRDMIEDLSPAWLLLVGIGGAVPSMDFSLGDVICATRVHDFCIHVAKEEGRDGFNVGGGPMHPRIRSMLGSLPAIKRKLLDWNSEESLTVPKPTLTVPSVNSRLYYGDTRWKAEVRRTLIQHFPKDETPRPPLVTSQPVASSDTLVKSASLMSQWLETARSVAAVEMELSGVYMAADRPERQYPILAIRGISDIVGFKREEAWTKYACHTSAAFAFALLRHEIPFPARID